MATAEDFEAAVHNFEVKLVLPNGQIKDEYKLTAFGTVEMEKKRIWQSEKVGHPLSEDLDLVLRSEQNEQIVAEDDKEILPYLKKLNVSEVELARKGSLRDQLPRAAKPANLGMNRRN